MVCKERQTLYIWRQRSDFRVFSYTEISVGTYAEITHRFGPGWQKGRQAQPPESCTPNRFCFVNVNSNWSQINLFQEAPSRPIAKQSRGYSHFRRRIVATDFNIVSVLMCIDFGTSNEMNQFRRISDEQFWAEH